MDKVKINEHLGNSDLNIIVWDLICDASISTSKQLIRLVHKANINK
jgi:hypothetical protein